MARIPKLDSAGKFLAADVNAQIDARTKATMRADLPALAEELKIGGGSGIEQVSGTVTLDSTGAPIREVYATASATVQGEALAAGDAAVFRRLGGAWDVLVVGKDAAWRRVGAVAPPTPDPGTTPPAAPTGVTASNVTSTTATLTWTASAGATGYRVSLDGEKTWTPVTGTTINLTGLLPSTLYAPKVQAFNGAYSASASGAPFTTAASKVYADTFDAPDGTALSGRVMPTGGATWVSPDNMLNTGNSALTITGGRATTTEVGGGASFLIPSSDTIVQVDYDVTAAEAQVRAGVDGAPYMTFNAKSGARLGTWSTPIVSMGLPRTGTLTHVYSGNSVTTYVNGRQYGKPFPVPAARPKLAVATFRGGKVDAIRVDPAMNPGVARAMTITESFDGAAGTSLIGTTTDTGGYQWISVNEYDLGVGFATPVLTGDGSVTNTGNGGSASIVTDAASDETVRVTATYDVSGNTARQVRVMVSGIAPNTGLRAIVYGTGEVRAGYGTEADVSVGTSLPLTGTIAVETAGGVGKVFVNGAQVGGTFTASASAVAASFGVWQGSKISNLEVTIK